MSTATLEHPSFQPVNIEGQSEYPGLVPEGITAGPETNSGLPETTHTIGALLVQQETSVGLPEETTEALSQPKVTESDSEETTTELQNIPKSGETLPMGSVRIRFNQERLTDFLQTGASELARNPAKGGGAKPVVRTGETDYAAEAHARNTALLQGVAETLGKFPEDGIVMNSGEPVIIVGENGSGKSLLQEAMVIAIEDEIRRQAGLPETDHYNNPMFNSEANDHTTNIERLDLVRRIAGCIETDLGGDVSTGLEGFTQYSQLSGYLNLVDFAGRDRFNSHENTRTTVNKRLETAMRGLKKEKVVGFDELDTGASPKAVLTDAIKTLFEASEDRIVVATAQSPLLSLGSKHIKELSHVLGIELTEKELDRLAGVRVINLNRPELGAYDPNTL